MPDPSPFRRRAHSPFRRFADLEPRPTNLAEPHRHQHVEERPVDLNHARTHLIDQV
jgi:hypothetical protein